MDPSQGDNSKRLKTSAGSGEATGFGASRVVDYRPQVLDGRRKVFMWRYNKQLNEHITRSEVNAFCGENGQTATCAHRAIDVYNRTHGTNYKLQKGGDSNAFSPLKSSESHTFYVHLNCDAFDPVKGKHTFFAELKGEDEPLTVTMVASLGKSDDDDDAEVSANSADHNCMYCTGLRHSLTREFYGFMEEDGHMS